MTGEVGAGGGRQCERCQSAGGMQHPPTLAGACLIMAPLPSAAIPPNRPSQKHPLLCSPSSSPPVPIRRCYDRAVLKLRGEAAETNFPREFYAEVGGG